jgi:hypothetical protein
MSHIHAEPRTSFVSTTTRRLLDMLPPFMQNSADIQAVLDACAAEYDRLEALRLKVLDNLWPQTAEEWLALYERWLGLSEAPLEKTLAARRNTVLAWLQGLSGSGTGADWVENMNDLIGTGWSYEEHDPGDPGSPDANVVLIRLAFTTEIFSPAAPTATPGGGGTLAADDYYYAVTATNFYGETEASPETLVTVGASGSVALDWADVAGASGYRIYRGTTSGQLLRIAASATSDYTDLGDASQPFPPPITNTTESYQAGEAKALARKITPAHIQLNFGYTTGFLVGVHEMGDAL